MDLTLNIGKKRARAYYRRGMFQFSVYAKPIMTKGISSKCEDKTHVLFLDYDNIAKWVFQEELEIMQKRFNLTPFYTFKTEETKEVMDWNVNGIKHSHEEMVGNYHAISLTKFSMDKIQDIIGFSSCDANFKTLGFRNKYRCWVLRTHAKEGKKAPTYIGIVGEPTNMDNSVSTAHLNMLKKLYDLDDLPYTNEDGRVKLFVQDYQTGTL